MKGIIQVDRMTTIIARIIALRRQALLPRAPALRVPAPARIPPRTLQTRGSPPGTGGKVSVEL